MSSREYRPKLSTWWWEFPQAKSLLNIYNSFFKKFFFMMYIIIYYGILLNKLSITKLKNSLKKVYSPLFCFKVFKRNSVKDVAVIEPISHFFLPTEIIA